MTRKVPTVEWPTVALAALTYGGWAGAGLWLWPVHPALALTLMTLLAALHASLVHEAVHGHPTRSPILNEAMVFWPLALVWPYRRFRALHLRHHRDEQQLTDALEDPESAFLTGEGYAATSAPMRAVLVANNTLAGRVVIGPVLAAAGLVAGDARRIAAGEPGVLRAWVLHAVGLAAVLAVVVLGFGIPLWLYALVGWTALGIICIRSFAEHRWAERPAERSIIVERTPLAILFLNNNLHVVHHTHPSVPWYALPALYRARRAEWVALNGGYVVQGYGALLRAYAFRPKQPVVHPAEGR